MNKNRNFKYMQVCNLLNFFYLFHYTFCPLSYMARLFARLAKYAWLSCPPHAYSTAKEQPPDNGDSPPPPYSPPQNGNENEENKRPNGRPTVTFSPNTLGGDPATSPGSVANNNCIPRYPSSGDVHLTGFFIWERCSTRFSFLCWLSANLIFFFNVLLSYLSWIMHAL